LSVRGTRNQYSKNNETKSHGVGLGFLRQWT
jgi:hypothetical protein